MDTPKYGWTPWDVFMNIDTVLYVDILNRQSFIEEKSLSRCLLFQR